jgi:hypothetical protein
MLTLFGRVAPPKLGTAVTLGTMGKHEIVYTPHTTRLITATIPGRGAPPKLGTEVTLGTMGKHEILYTPHSTRLITATISGRGTLLVKPGRSRRSGLPSCSYKHPLRIVVAHRHPIYHKPSCPSMLNLFGRGAPAQKAKKACSHREHAQDRVLAVLIQRGYAR